MLYPILKKPFFGRFQVEWKNPLPEDEKTEWKEIDFRNNNGVLLKALYAQSKLPIHRASILLAHPMMKIAKGYYLKNGLADFFRMNGFNVMVFDFNGFGESDMGSFHFTLDVKAAARKLQELSPNLPIGYLGSSFGAGAGICYLSNANHPFQFFIADSPYTHLLEFWKHYPFPHRVMKVFRWYSPGFYKKVSPNEHIKSVRSLSKLLFIYGEEDIYTPIVMGREFQSLSNAEIDLLTFPGAGHNESYESYPDIYKEKILAHIEEMLN